MIEIQEKPSVIEIVWELCRSPWWFANQPAVRFNQWLGRFVCVGEIGAIIMLLAGAVKSNLLWLLAIPLVSLLGGILCWAILLIANLFVDPTLD